MLGWEMSPDQLGERRPALNGLVKNLYFTGHWTQPGGGITPVIVSAMQVANRITKGKTTDPTFPVTDHEVVDDRGDFNWVASAAGERELALQ
jgi:hypothetical protein